MRAHKIRKWYTSRRNILHWIKPVAPVPTDAFDILQKICFLFYAIRLFSTSSKAVATESRSSFETIYECRVTDCSYYLKCNSSAVKRINILQIILCWCFIFNIFLQPFITSSFYICPVLLCLTLLLLFLGFEIFDILSSLFMYLLLSISSIFNCVLLKFTSSVDSRKQLEAKGNCYFKSFTCCIMLRCSNQGRWDGQGKCHTWRVEKFTKNFSPKIWNGWGCYGDICVWRNNSGMHIQVTV